jgi:hypothetical protein
MPLELFARGGLLWANAPAGPDAVVLVDGEIRYLRKYASSEPSPAVGPTRAATPGPSTSDRPGRQPSASPGTSRPGDGPAGPAGAAGTAPPTGPGGTGTAPGPSGTGPAAGGPPARCGSVLVADAVLDGDLSCTQATAVTIAADRVTLDLRGYTISYTGGPTDGTSVGVAVTDARNVTVRGGTVRYFGRQVAVSGSIGVTLADLRLTDQGGLRVAGSRDVRMDNVSAGGLARGRPGLYVEDSTVTARHSSFVGDSGSCVRSTCTLTDSTFTVTGVFTVAAATLSIERSTVWCQVCAVSNGGTVAVTNGTIRRLNVSGGMPNITGNTITDIGLRLGLDPAAPPAPGGPAVTRNTVTGSSIVITTQSDAPITGMTVTENTVDGAPGDNLLLARRRDTHRRSTDRRHPRRPQPHPQLPAVRHLGGPRLGARRGRQHVGRSTLRRRGVPMNAGSYDAFISYSHRYDRSIARLLHPVIQRIGKPWWRRRGLTVFRDENDLSAHPELWPEIERRLARSVWLVVLASPAAAGVAVGGQGNPLVAREPVGQPDPDRPHRRSHRLGSSRRRLRPGVLRRCPTGTDGRVRPRAPLGRRTTPGPAGVRRGTAGTGTPATTSPASPPRSRRPSTASARAISSGRISGSTASPGAWPGPPSSA